MDLSSWTRVSDFEWRVEPSGPMRVPVVVFADEVLMREMDEQVLVQARNVAMLPGVVAGSFVMPDGHWGYGFPIGGVAAFDAARGGVISAGGVGFDISCGVRTLLTGMTLDEIEPAKAELADALFAAVPCGVGQTGKLRLSDGELDALLAGGALWAVRHGFGRDEDLERIEEHGCMAGAEPSSVSPRSKERQRAEVGTLGSGNHYLEVQHVTEIRDARAAEAFGLREGEIVVTIHCGSRGLGHQIGTEFLRDMVVAAPRFGLELPDRELACAPIDSDLGRKYLGAMRAAVNCALANRQVISHLVRQVFAERFPGRRGFGSDLPLLFDVSHNTCKQETHEVGGERRELFVHRKGATRAFGPGDPSLPAELRPCGQPVLIGGSMGTSSYVLAGEGGGSERAFASACHGAGRSKSRRAALQEAWGSAVVRELEARGILIRSPSMRGVAEEAPSAYKDVSRVVEAAEHAGLARIVAKLVPIVCVKG